MNHTPCPHAKKCGGCQLQNMDYQQQLEHKQKTEVRLLGRYAHVEPIIGMRYPYNYRNKVQAAFGTARGGKIISGVYQSNSHRIVPVDKCMIEDKIADKIIVTIREMLQSFKMTAYNEDIGRGFLRHVLVKRGFKTNQIMVVLVTAVAPFPSKHNFIRVLLEKHPEITTIVQNINTADTNLVLGPKQIVLHGTGYIEDELCGCRFRISPKSFYQINPVQTDVLYSKAIEFAGLTGKERVIDAYCGIGTIGLVAAKRGASEVIGVELNPDAVRDAKVNAKLNDGKNIRFFTGDAGDFMCDMAEAGEKADVVFMDPPRAGSTEKFISAVNTLAPEKVVYISCNPETLARDLRYFTTATPYKVRKIQPVDMFPFTGHVETVCLLSKLTDAKHHVEVELHLDEMDLTSAESKATYDEIRDYVMEQTGLHVTNLNIAQIKRKCGIIERENYNFPKSEDSKQPNCTKEKEDAIRDAFRHFGMI